MEAQRKILSSLTFPVLYNGCFSVSAFPRKSMERVFQNSLKDWSAKFTFNFCESKAPKPTGPLEILAIEYNSREQSQRLYVVPWELNYCQTFLCVKHSDAAMAGAIQNLEQTDNKPWLSINYCPFFPKINGADFTSFEGCSLALLLGQWKLMTRQAIQRVKIRWHCTV